MATIAESLVGLDGATVLILGVSYRGGVKETAYSGAFSLLRILEASGSKVLADDPMYSPDELRGLGFKAWSGERVDAIIVQADHARYRELGSDDFEGVKVVFDGRGILDRRLWTDDGLKFTVIGQG